VVIDERCHGYYIHGRSVHSAADTGMDELNAFLRQEASDICPRRGLNDTDEQSFEIHVSMEWRRQFDTIYTPNANQGDIVRTNGMRSRLTNDNAVGQVLKPANENNLRTYKVVKRFLASFLDNVALTDVDE
jgi:meckelin